MSLGTDLGLTRRLLRRAARHRGVVMAAVAAMILTALAETAPIALAKAAVGVIFPETGTAQADTISSWFEQTGVAWAARLGFEDAEPRLAGLGLIVLCLFGVGVVSAAANYGHLFFAHYMAALIIRDLRCSLMDRVLSVRVGWFSKRKVGDLVSRFAVDADQTRLGAVAVLSNLTLQPLILVFAAAAAFVLNWRLALASTLVLPFLAVGLAKLGSWTHRQSGKSLVSLGEASEAVNQTLSGLRIVKAFGAEDLERQRYARVNDDWLRRRAKMASAKAATRGLMVLMYALSLGIALAVGGSLVITEEWGLSSDEFGAFLVALATVYRPLRRITNGHNDWQASMAAARRVFEVLDERTGEESGGGATELGPVTRSVAFEQVSFAYPGGDGADTPVLRDVSFQIPAGATVALVGPSGSGKSTIVDLVMGFRDPDSGRIIVDGIPLSEIRTRSLLEQIAIVGQHPFVFNATVAENISYGCPDATKAEIESAARAAQIHEVIAALPSGYDSVVGERGDALSGGQLQRLTIARALLRDASLLILDEATSNLDTESERAVQDALDNSLKGKTKLVIAHRLSTVVDADLILVMDDGRIAEQGTHDQLMTRDGVYARLYKAQT